MRGAAERGCPRPAIRLPCAAMHDWGRARALGTGLLVVLASHVMAACSNWPDNPGIDPYPAELHYPTGLAVMDLDPTDGSSAPTHMVVANSDFDLGFNAAAVQSYDLRVLNSAIDQNCAGLPVWKRQACVVASSQARSATDHPSTLTDVYPTDGLFLSEVLIEAYADGMEIGSNGTRLYIPVRSNSDVTRVDVSPDGLLSCGGTPGVREHCTDAYESTLKSAAELRGVDYVTDPVDLVTGSLSEFGLPADMGDYVAMAHRSGAMSFFVVPGTGMGTDQPDQPILTGTLLGIGNSLAGIVREPTSTSSTFWIASGNSTYVPRVTVAIDGQSTTPQVISAGVSLDRPVPIIGLDFGTSRTANFRQFAFDPRPGYEGRVYGVSRRPDALAFFRRDELSGSYVVEDLVPIGIEGMRMQLVTFDDAQMNTHLVAFVSCYQSRNIFVIDVDHRKTIGIVSGLSGPFEFEVDKTRQRLYVLDFRTSVVRVVTLAPLVACLTGASSSPNQQCSPEILGMLGVPNAVEYLR